MRFTHIFLYPLVLMAFINTARAQSCAGNGQTPATAFPVCGTQTFSQHSVPICGNNIVPGPTCNNQDNGLHQDKNPYWYKFTCFKAGTLGFTITPNVMADDYDWQLFDITGKAPNDVFTDVSLFVSMNWSGEPGITGASSAGRGSNVCGGLGQPLFSSMPQLIEGHEYLLLISHFTNSQSGYSLTFGGGTASITDTKVPHLEAAAYNCGPFTVGIKLNKHLRCNSLAANGSDFAFAAAGPGIVGATGIGCTNGFDMDSLVLQLNGTLAPGNYTIVTKKGSDNNTLLDVCGSALATGESISFTVEATPPVPMGTINTVSCAPDQLEVTFPSAIRCSSVSGNGSDFVLSGPAGNGVTIIGASTVCNADGVTDKVTLLLNRRILMDGDYYVTLTDGGDGNTIESECHVQTPPGGRAGFHIDPQPPVLLRSMAPVGCAPDLLKIGLSIPVRCSSIAADGSDFIISGTTALGIQGATGNCNANGLADTVIVQLSQPVEIEGTFELRVTTGTDGNTLQSECWQPAATGQPVTFRTAATVNAAFDYTIDKACKISTLHFSHPGGNGVNAWKWNFDGGQDYNTQQAVMTYDSFGEKEVRLEVSNGTCSAVSVQTIALTSTLEALFSVEPGPYCPLDMISPKNESYGNIVSYQWDYGNGQTSVGPTPVSQRYFPVRREEDFRIRLIVEDDLHCQDTADHYIKAAASCYIDVPNAFSPNYDGQNDYLYPLNAYKAIDLHFMVYNRVGQLIFETNDWKKRWDGTLRGNPADIGTYIWVLRYTEKDTGKKVFRKGTVVLIR